MGSTAGVPQGREGLWTGGVAQWQKHKLSMFEALGSTLQHW